jgi:hypothetical protein
MSRIHSLAMGLTITMMITACGGSDDAPPPPQDTRTAAERDDDAASASVAGLIAFVMAQITSATSDASEPRNVGGITAPVNESDEPLVI